MMKSKKRKQPADGQLSHQDNGEQLPPNDSGILRMNVSAQAQAAFKKITSLSVLFDQESDFLPVNC